MFLRAGKEDFSFSRLKRALPVFFLLWCGAVLLALTVLVTVHSHLQHIEIRETEEALDLFLAGHQMPQKGSGLRPQFFNKLSRDLVFVRVVRGGEQLFLLDNSEGIEGLKELADISPEETGTWLSLAKKKKSSPMTVISRRLDSGTIIQAGKDGRESYQLFHELMWDTIYALIGGIIVLWLVAMFFVKQSLAPLVDTRKQVHELGKGATQATLPEEGNGPELDGLYQEINTLLRRNRRLVHEIQDSLDNVAHDLRTPMTRLRSVAEYGLQEEEPDKLREALSDCLEESERVLAMLRIMMSVAEAESGVMRLEPKKCDLAESLAQVCTLYEYVAEERNIRIILDIGDTPVFAGVDATRIGQVWANLLDNAIKYGHEGGWVRVTLEAEPDWVTVSFADDGIGLSETEKPRIWERLFRGDRSRSQKGLGLGLNYVRAVVVAHGGEVGVQSALRQGSTFSVRLPRGSEAAPEIEKSQIRGE